MNFVLRNPRPTSEQQMSIEWQCAPPCVSRSKQSIWTTSPACSHRSPPPPRPRPSSSSSFSSCPSRSPLPSVCTTCHSQATRRLSSGWLHSQQSKAPANVLDGLSGPALRGLTMSTLTTASDVYSSGGGAREGRVTESTGINTHSRRHASTQHIEHSERGWFCNG